MKAPMTACFGKKHVSGQTWFLKRQEHKEGQNGKKDNAFSGFIKRGTEDSMCRLPEEGLACHADSLLYGSSRAVVFGWL